MTVNEKIIAALSPVVPVVVPGVYRPIKGAGAKEYIDFSYTSSPADFADDTPDAEVYQVIVRYTCPPRQDSLATRRRIKRAIAGIEGGVWPSEIDISDEDAQGYAYEFELACPIEEDV
jgi:hypothetical protein